jgi:four helix bundle protein
VAVSRYEDLIVWSKARTLSSELWRLSQRTSHFRDRDLWRQMTIAGVSTMANIAEGFLRRDRKDFARFLRIAGASNGEVRALLYAALDRGHLATEDATKLIDATNEIGRMLRSLEQYARSKN